MNNAIENPGRRYSLTGRGRLTGTPAPGQSLPPWEPYGDGVNYRQYRNALDIVWVEHNFYTPDWHAGDLIVGFNSAFPGTGDFNPNYLGVEDLGPVTDNWVQVYTSDILVIRFKPHTQRLEKVNRTPRSLWRGRAHQQ